MYKVILRKTNIEKRKLRVRNKISGTAERPRLSVFRSNKYIYAQLVDDVAGVTLVFASNATDKIKKDVKKVDASLEIGKLIASKALEKNIKTVVFDRNGYRYHGRVKNVAEGAREGGLVL